MMRDDMDLMMCCKSVGTDLSMLDIDDFMTEISQLKKEVALLETKLRLRGDEGLKREDVDVVCCESSTQDSELSLTLLCYTESNPTDTQDTTVCDSNQDLQDDESPDQTSTESLDSVWNAGEQQQILQTKLKMCSVKLIDCTNIMMETRRETTVDEDNTEEDEVDDFIPEKENSDSCSEGETSKERQTAQSLSCITGGETLSSQRHLERQHTEQKHFNCRRCKISFTTLQERRRHHSKLHREKKKRTEQKLFTCRRCKISFPTLDELKRHRSRLHRVTKQQPFHCEQCGKDFFTTSSFIKRHMRTHSDEKSFHCSECDKYFSTKGNLDAHQRIHTGEKPYECPHCEKRFNHKPHLKKHMRSHTNERPYQCSECGKTFRKSWSLKIHQKTHTDEKHYKCSYCDKRFFQMAHLMAHERVHTGEKPYICSHCGKTFSDPSHFRIHLRTHTGEKPHHCNICGKSFGQQANLLKHQRIHTGERPYKCSQCEKTFTQPDVLKTHQRVHTGEKPYVCSICGERFAYLRSFQSHQKKHTEEQTTPKSS